MRYKYDWIEIGPEHVGQLSLDLWGTKWWMPNQFGVLQWQDVGKRLYRIPTEASLAVGGAIDYILQMENDEQHQARITRQWRALNG